MPAEAWSRKVITSSVSSMPKGQPHMCVHVKMLQ
jgi:hypothetical protein